MFARSGSLSIVEESFLLLTLFLFLASAAAIYLACEYFVNGIEWCGQRLNLSSTAVGTVLAAFGTALPESAVTFMAVVFGQTPQQKDIGVGAAMGGPLVLATVAYAVVGIALLLNRGHLSRDTATLTVDHNRLSQDQGTFLVIFIVKVALGLVAFSFKPWLGVLFLAAYAIYVRSQLTSFDKPAENESLEPLKISPLAADPSLGWALVQTTLALIVIAFASHTFVAQLETIGDFLNWSPHVVALLLSPIATELPEVMNALIWVRQGKENLALANISGAMMIQATVPSALGLFFTPWRFDAPLIASAIATIGAIIYLWTSFRRGPVDARRLVPVALFYLAFAAFVAYHFYAR